MLICHFEYLPNCLQDNLATSFNVLKVGAPALAEAGGGNLVCVGAAVVHYGMKNHEAWAAAKGAVEGEQPRRRSVLVSLTLAVQAANL
jgi:NADP-dependent 3-hydroxy acid dehydrogenase YdfG